MKQADEAADANASAARKPARGRQNFWLPAKQLRNKMNEQNVKGGRQRGCTQRRNGKRP
jgi:hypothetical protein